LGDADQASTGKLDLELPLSALIAEQCENNSLKNITY